MSHTTAFPGEEPDSNPDLHADLKASAHASPHLEDPKNPFETPFDGKEEEEEWWDDEKHEESAEDEQPEEEEKDLAEEEYPGNPENTPIVPSTSKTTVWQSFDGREEFEAARHTVTRKTDKRYSVQKPTRNKSRGRQRKQNAKAGIKVITDFSRHTASSQAPQPGQAPAAVLQGNSSQTGNFINLATLQTLDREVPVEPTGWNFWSKKSKSQDPKTTNANSADKAKVTEAPSFSTGSKSRRRSLVPAPLKLEDDLSPSDRPIVIGLSVSSARLAEHAQSPYTAVSDTTRTIQSHQDRRPGHNHLETHTPTITVTPASGEPTTWSPLDETYRTHERRPASSIYSQATNPSPNPNNGKTPTVPAVPAYMLKAHMTQQGNDRSVPYRESTNTVFDEDAAFPQRSPTRRISTFTVFEEDETPTRASNTRPHIATNEPGPAQDENITTPTTSRRSRGWWNYVMTPFMTRSNTVAAKHDAMKEGQPTTPNLEAAAIKARDSNRADQVWEKEFSPTTATSEAWYRNGKLDAELHDTERPIVRATELERDEHFRTHKVQQSSATLPFVMSGTPGTDNRASRQQPLPSDNPSHNLSRESPSSFANRRAERDLARQASAATALSNNDRDIPLVFDIDSPVQNRRNPFMQPRPTISAREEQPDRYENLPPPPPPPLPAPVNATNITYNMAPRWQVDERTVSRDRADDSQYTSPRPPPPYSPPRPQFARFAPRDLAQTTDNDVRSGRPRSPDPVSPGMHQIMTATGGIPLRDVPLESPTRRRPINLNSGYPGPQPSWNGGAYITGTDVPASPNVVHEARRKGQEKDDAPAKKAGGFWGRIWSMLKWILKKLYQKWAAARKKQKRYVWLIIAFLLIIGLIIGLSVGLTRKSSPSVELTQWLNLTGFPPIFLGISTIAVPVNTVVDTSCVTPATFWSCDLPKELQSTVAPSGPNQPNFRLEIQWDNSNAANATFSNVTGNKNLPVKRSSEVYAISASQFFKRVFLGARQTSAFSPVPSPPSFAEEFFLGNTTDGIVSAQKAGEPTPFYITFLSPTGDISAQLNTLRKRKFSASNSNSNSTSTSSTNNTFPDISAGIPPPSIDTDGTASPANLLPSPLPIQQTVRLYDRGLPTEHYGFYSYFDRSIFLSSVNLTTGSGEVPIDENGGATEAHAKFRCTWAQTRFLVQIWTNMEHTAKLNNATSSTSSTSTQITNKHQPSRNFTATDFSQPGSFPYPVTVTMDRHGGNPSTKEIYCYQIDEEQKYVDVHPTFQLEDRGSGGTLISPSPSVFDPRNVTEGGVDGGSGGCKCGWQNWVAVSGG